MIRVRSCFDAPLMDVMNFLNEAGVRYPDAISFAPGRPDERFFEVERAMPALQRYVAHRAAERGLPEAAVLADLGQYQRTNGVVNDLVARQLAADEAIVVPPEAVMVTAGAQEAMLVLLLGLFDPARDVLLCSDPTYIGITGPAAMLGVEVVAVRAGPNGLEAAAVEEALAGVRARGRVPRAIYDVPDFNNPLGTSMPMEARRELLRVARDHELLVFEDNPYGMFAYDGPGLPALRAMDGGETVVYIGSYAKTVFPGLRLGLLVASQPCAPDGRPLAVALSKAKSLTTVTTAPLAQAVLGGLLLASDCSLRPLVGPRRDHYRANRDRMLRRLAEEFDSRGLEGRVRWNHPRGGFFLTLDLPFAFDDDCHRACASEFGVIVCPMRFFCLLPGREHQVRLSFSYVDAEQIDVGISRLADFVSRRLRS